jgi:hypothetical protein
MPRVRRSRAARKNKKSASRSKVRSRRLAPRAASYSRPNDGVEKARQDLQDIANVLTPTLLQNLRKSRFSQYLHNVADDVAMYKEELDSNPDLFVRLINELHAHWTVHTKPLLDLFLRLQEFQDKLSMQPRRQPEQREKLQKDTARYLETIARIDGFEDEDQLTSAFEQEIRAFLDASTYWYETQPKKSRSMVGSQQKSQSKDRSQQKSQSKDRSIAPQKKSRTQKIKEWYKNFEWGVGF